MVLTRAQRRQSADQRPSAGGKKGDGEPLDTTEGRLDGVGSQHADAKSSQQHEAEEPNGASVKNSKRTQRTGKDREGTTQTQAEEPKHKAKAKGKHGKRKKQENASHDESKEKQQNQQSGLAPKTMTFQDLVSAAELELQQDLALCKEDEKSMKEQGYCESALQGFGAGLPTRPSTSKTQRGPQHQMTAAQLAQHSAEAVPHFHLSKIQERAIKRDQSLQNDSTGKRWFNMPAAKLTDDVKRELQLLKLRNTLDQSHFFKRDDSKALPKYFQMGRVEHSAAEFFTERTSKRAKKMSLVDELLQDSERRHSRKKRVAKIMASRKNHTRKGLGLHKRRGKVGSKHKKR